MAHLGQSRPDAGLGLQEKVLEMFQVVFTSLGSGLLARERRGSEQLLLGNVQRFQGGLVFKARRGLYHSSLGLRVIKKKEEAEGCHHATPTSNLLFFITLKPRLE